MALKPSTTSKLVSEKSLEMIRGGAAYGAGEAKGPTGSGCDYPKGGKVPLTPDFNPMKDRRVFQGWLTKGV